MMISPEFLPQLCAFGSQDFLVSVLVGIAAIYLATELLFSRATARFRDSEKTRNRPPNSLS